VRVTSLYINTAALTSWGGGGWCGDGSAAKKGFLFFCNLSGGSESVKHLGNHHAIHCWEISRLKTAGAAAGESESNQQPACINRCQPERESE